MVAASPIGGMEDLQPGQIIHLQRAQRRLDQVQTGTQYHEITSGKYL